MCFSLCFYLLFISIITLFPTFQYLRVPLDTNLSYFMKAVFCHLQVGMSVQKFHFSVSNRSVYYVLLLCGDVALNPGPTQWPCMVCDKCVKSNQKAFLCDSCGNWFHICCIGVGDSRYIEFCTVGNLTDTVHHVCLPCCLPLVP